MGNLVRVTGGDVLQVYDLEDAAIHPILGTGGQGVVYATGADQCVKVMHDPQECAGQLATVKRILNDHPKLYIAVREVATIPYWLVRESSPSDKVVGYGMERLNGWSPLSSIMSPFGSRELSVGRKEVALIFIALHQALSQIHAQGFIVGDLNASNIMFKEVGGPYQVKVIDVDTWSVRRPEFGLTYDCSVIDTEDACHPDYQRAIRDGLRPTPQYSHDWWAFAFHLYRALTKHDPFSEGDYLGYSRTERISEGITTQTMGVELAPEAKSEIKHIGRRLLAALDKHLKVQRANPFPLKLIASLYSETSA